MKYHQGELKQAVIYQFQGDRYLQVPQSRFFPGFDLNAILADCLRDAYQSGSGAIKRLSDRFPPPPGSVNQE